MYFIKLLFKNTIWKVREQDLITRLISWLIILDIICDFILSCDHDDYSKQNNITLII
jgi:hypothetical protein